MRSSGGALDLVNRSNKLTSGSTAQFHASSECAASFPRCYAVRAVRSLSVAAKKGASLAVEREPGVRLRFGRRWAQEWRGSDYFFSEAELSSLLTRGVR